jgi:hypothetical protein
VKINARPEHVADSLPNRGQSLKFKV